MGCVKTFDLASETWAPFLPEQNIALDKVYFVEEQVYATYIDHTAHRLFTFGGEHLKLLN